MQGRRAARALGLAIAIAATAAAPARADVFNVTTTADTLPGQVPCTASCSLRSALEAADSRVGSDQVVVPAGTYTLTNGALAVGMSAGVTVTGAGAATTVITANGASQVLTIAGEALATFTGVTLRDGNALSGSGGNVSVSTSGKLGLDHVRVSNGTAINGGGIATSGAAALAISASLIDGNSAGGISIGGGGNVLIRDTTVAFNTGGGFVMQANALTTQLQATTIAYNQGGGVVLATASSGTSIGGSILAGNSPSNCAGAAVASDAGGNVESGSDCGLAGHQNADPQLATALADAGGQTPVLPVAATSPAVDVVPTCLSGADQRDVARPQGAACDAGAYELVPVEPPPPPPPPAPTPTPTPAPVATPEPQKSVAGQVVGGTVRVRRPGSSTFIEIDPTQPIPLGSTIDAKQGEIRITALQKKGGKPQTATFFDGIFKITQTRTTTDLTLTEALATCGTGAHAAASKPKTRKLWGKGSGSFRTRGQYSSATVRGTEWLVQDTCAGTLTRVKHGVVSVRDTVKRKTIILRAGKRYLARPRRR